jgi:GT2 family glycosyltransferase
MISLVMAVRDALPWTRRAIDSIIRNTEGAFELIVVDNASRPDTGDFLRRTGARVLRNEDNRGCAAAWNQGIAAAGGDHVCLVNNDIEVPAGWLDRLAAFHRAHPFAWVSPAIREGLLDYDLEAVNRVAHARFGGRYFPDEFRGMVLYSRRDLYRRVGSFDEAFARAKYEDEDMFWRLRRAGLGAAVTLNVVVHHHGSRTVREERPRTPGFEALNKRYFDQKWRAERRRRKSWKLKLAVRRFVWQLRGGPRY